MSTEKRIGVFAAWGRRVFHASSAGQDSISASSATRLRTEPVKPVAYGQGEESSKCAGCSKCYAKPIEEYPSAIREKLENIRSLVQMIEALVNEGNLDGAQAVKRRLFQKMMEFRFDVELRNAINNIISAHADEATAAFIRGG